MGARELRVDLEGRRLVVGDTVDEGDEITIDGTGGRVFLGRAHTIQPGYPELRELLGWADEARAGVD